MYSFCTHTWNAIKGKCSHDCSYCYMKRFPQGDLRFDEKELKTNLGEGNFIFIGSSCDMFADDVPDSWIDRIFNHTDKYPKNTYLFQTKNTKRFVDLNMDVPTHFILGTTAETNRNSKVSKAPFVKERLIWLSKINARRMITIEPIMDFDLKQFVRWIKNVEPEFVNIGADSMGHNLPEPSKEKIEQLIKELEKFTKVNLKDNLKRIYSQKV